MLLGERGDTRIIIVNEEFREKRGRGKDEG